MLENFCPELISIQDSKFITTDAWSRLDVVDTNNPIKPNMSSLAEYYSVGNEDVPHLVNYKSIMWCQQNHKSLIEITKLMTFFR